MLLCTEKTPVHANPPALTYTCERLACLKVTTGRYLYVTRYTHTECMKHACKLCVAKDVSTRTNKLMG